VEEVEEGWLKLPELVNKKGSQLPKQEGEDGGGEGMMALVPVKDEKADAKEEGGGGGGGGGEAKLEGEGGKEGGRKGGEEGDPFLRCNPTTDAERAALLAKASGPHLYELYSVMVHGGGVHTGKPSLPSVCFTFSFSSICPPLPPSLPHLPLQATIPPTSKNSSTRAAVGFCSTTPSSSPWTSPPSFVPGGGRARERGREGGRERCRL